MNFKPTSSLTLSDSSLNSSLKGVYWLLSQLCAFSATALLATQIRLGSNLINTDFEQKTVVVLLILTHLLASFFVYRKIMNNGRINIITLMASPLFPFTILVACLYLAKIELSNYVILGSYILGVVLIFFSLVVNFKAVLPLYFLLLISALATQALGEKPHNFLKSSLQTEIKKTSRETLIIDSSLHFIIADYYDNYFQICADEKHCNPPRNGGGIDLLGEGYIVATGEGRLFYATIDDEEKLTVERLKYEIPINDNALIASLTPEQLDKSLWLFRVTDILIRQNGSNFELYAAHHFWNVEESCFVLRISKLEDSISSFVSNQSNAEWKTLYQTSPCIPMQEQWSMPFRGDESGGRMAFLNDRELLFTTGDHQFDGVNIAKSFAQDKHGDYGKTLVINLSNSQKSLFTLGHRNPQGLLIDNNGSIWSTEHGAKGGDELNLLQKDKNYGWPKVTLGTNYGQSIWPLNGTTGQHPHYTKPIYSWIPSIAVSNLIKVQKNGFNFWQGDFLVGSYKETLFRLRIRDGRVIFAEPIKIRSSVTRIRDLVEDDSGRIVTWLDRGSIGILKKATKKDIMNNASATAEIKSQILFSQCSGCHSLTGGSNHGIGPDLGNVLNGDIGTARGYSYSNALQKINGSWTDKKLNAFLENPQKFAPGTKMAFEGITNPEERKLIIQHIRKYNSQ